MIPPSFFPFFLFKHQIANGADGGGKEAKQHVSRKIKSQIPSKARQSLSDVGVGVCRRGTVGARFSSLPDFASWSIDRMKGLNLRLKGLFRARPNKPEDDEAFTSSICRPVWRRLLSLLLSSFLLLGHASFVS